MKIRYQEFTPLINVVALFESKGLFRLGDSLPKKLSTLQLYESFTLPKKAVIELKSNYKNKSEIKANIADLFIEKTTGDWVVIPFLGGMYLLELLDSSVHTITDTELGELKNYQEELIDKNEPEFLDCSTENSIELHSVRTFKYVEKDFSFENYNYEKLTALLESFSLIIDISELKPNIEKNTKRLLISEALKNKETVKTLEIFRQEYIHETFKNLVKSYFMKQGATKIIEPLDNKTGIDLIVVFEFLKSKIRIKVIHETVPCPENGGQIQLYTKPKDSKDASYNTTNLVITSIKIFDAQHYNYIKEQGAELIDGKRFIAMLYNYGIS